MLWLPDAILECVTKRPGPSDAVSAQADQVVSSVEPLALEALSRGASSFRDLVDLAAAARSLSRTPPDCEGPYSDALIAEAWRLACRKLCWVIGAPHVTRMIRGEVIYRADVASHPIERPACRQYFSHGDDMQDDHSLA